ncbi:MAG: zinc-dependent peptidase [Flavobacteriales bacterium]|nr:zinc-dependent peptidase [Flavobacteriales bacterium]
MTPGVFTASLCAVIFLRLLVSTEFVRHQFRPGSWYYLVFERKSWKKFGVYDQYLSSHCDYYYALSRRSKLLFLHRLAVVLANKRFYGSPGYPITREQQMSVAIALVTMTFGIGSYYDLPVVKHIRFHPDSFEHQAFGVKLNGLATSTGILHFSWKNLQEGIEIPTDGRNLAYHELAHAFMFEFPELNNSTAYHRLKRLADIMMPFVANGEVPQLRAYGGENFAEFWAVAIEAYFEDPRGMLNALPALYELISDILEQDLARSADPRIA